MRIPHLTKHLCSPVVKHAMNGIVPAILVLLFTPTMLAGQVRLTISAPDSLAFTLRINGEQVNTLALASCTVPGLSAGKLLVQLSFANGTTHEQSLTLKDRVHTSYALVESRDSWRLSISSEVAYTPAQATGLIATAAAPSSDPAAKDVEIIEAGCPQPCSPEDFETLKRELGNTMFEMKKLEKMRSFAMLTCMRVDQLRYMLAQLEVEDSKLKLIEASKSNVYDTSRLELVLNDFFLEKNRERARTLLDLPPP